MVIKKIIIYTLIVFLSANLSYAKDLVNNESKDLKILNEQNLELLSFEDFIELYRDENYKKEITYKIFNEPVVNNSISIPEKNYEYKRYKKMGKYIRVSFWSIDGGKNYEEIKDVFLSPDSLTENIDVQNSKIVYIKGGTITQEEAKEKVIQEAQEFSRSDILMLNEVDIGLERTGYKNMVEEISTILKYNYVFIPEFIEIDPTILGVKKEDIMNPDIPSDKIETTVNKEKLKAITANAILCKFPIENPRVIRIPNYYDWYKDEKKGVFVGEKIKRFAAKNVLNEKSSSQVRIGSRCALLANVKINEDTLTLVTLQLEGRSNSVQRSKQIQYVLDQIKDVNNPVVIAGNMNTTTRDNAPTTPKRILKNTFTDVHNLARFGVGLIFPPGLILNITRPTIDYFRKSSDPTVKSIPIIAPNYERKVFNNLKNFEFEDGYRFDFRGNDKSDLANFDPNGWLSNSNERAHVGFVPTYHINRNFGIANSKIDWMFVKGYRKDPFDKKEGSEKFAPHNAKTSHALNFAYKTPISRHAPLSVDMAITDFKNFSQIESSNSETKKSKNSI